MVDILALNLPYWIITPYQSEVGWMNVIHLISLQCLHKPWKCLVFLRSFKREQNYGGCKIQPRIDKNGRKCRHSEAYVWWVQEDDFRNEVSTSWLNDTLMWPLTLVASSFKACLADCMPKFKLNVRRHLLKFNDNSINDDDTLDDLRNRRMVVAKTLFGKLGLDTNIEAPLFCTWGCNTFIGKNVYINRECVACCYPAKILLSMVLQCFDFW